MDRAVAAHVLPPFDLKTPRWSGPLVDQILADAERYAAAIPDLVDDQQMRDLLGWDYGQWRRAADAGLLPDPDLGRFWTRAAAEHLAARGGALAEQIPPPPMGARRCAELLADRTGLPVDYDDIGALAERGLTSVVDYHDVRPRRSFPLYDVAALEQIAGDADSMAVLAEVIADRQAWLAASATTEQALELLPGWTEHDLLRQARTRNLTTGRGGRWPLAGIAELSGDRDLVDQVRRAQLLWPREATDLLGIRPTDWQHLVNAQLIRPAGETDWKPPWQREPITTALYRRGDVEDSAAWPGPDLPLLRIAEPDEQAKGDPPEPGSPEAG
ncbi:hypothetical protein AB0J52_13010 [Spirillospora sp. NPDC049652]